MSKLTPTQSSWVRETSMSILELIAEADEGSTEPAHGLDACVLAAAALAIELGVSGNCLARMAKFARGALSEPEPDPEETSQITPASEPPAAAPELHKEQP